MPRSFSFFAVPVPGMGTPFFAAEAFSATRGIGSDLSAFYARFVDWEFRGKLRHFRANSLFGFGVADRSENVGDPVADLLHFRFAHAARGDGRRAETNAAGFHRGQGIEGNRILVDRKSTRLNSSHSQISYAVFCLKKK